MRSFNVAKVFQVNTDRISAINFSVNGEHLIPAAKMTRLPYTTARRTHNYAWLIHRNMVSILYILLMPIIRPYTVRPKWMTPFVMWVYKITSIISLGISPVEFAERLIFAAGVNSESIKLYDLRSFDKEPFVTFKLNQQMDCDWLGLKFSRNGKTILYSVPLYS